MAAMSASAPVPTEAVLVVNAHSRKGRTLFRKAAFALRVDDEDGLLGHGGECGHGRH